ncbi:MAG: hypothetical protein KDA20_12550 [Phycisphaerales bacterium]|nr:hypothetical protein [Phycisphaerales bacterium]
MRITIRPLSQPTQELEITDRLIAAIADELSARFGGNEQLNWLEAERHLNDLLDRQNAPRGRPRHTESDCAA